jgi:hypothetical protein
MESCVLITSSSDRFKEIERAQENRNSLSFTCVRTDPFLHDRSDVKKPTVSKIPRKFYVTKRESRIKAIYNTTFPVLRLCLSIDESSSGTKEELNGDKVALKNYLGDFSASTLCFLKRKGIFVQKHRQSRRR